MISEWIHLEQWRLPVYSLPRCILLSVFFGMKLTFSTVWIYFTPNWAHNLPGYASSAGLQNLCWLCRSQVFCGTIWYLPHTENACWLFCYHSPCSWYARIISTTLSGLSRAYCHFCLVHRPLPLVWSGGGLFQVTLDVPGWPRVGSRVTLGFSLSLTCAAPSVIAFCCSDWGKIVCIFELCGRKWSKVIFLCQIINL